MSTELPALMEAVARRLLGEPNKALSKKGELRYGNKGSLKVDVKRGTFYDHEKEEGGGVLDLVRRERPSDDPLEWLRSERLVDDSTVVATFDYRDEANKLLFQVCRTPAKAFYQRRPNGSGWINKIEGVRRVLYRLPELLAEKGMVFIPEGEKHVDALIRLGLRATCNSGGAGKWRPEYADFLRGRDVIVLPDNDEPGRKHAQTIAQSLHGVATRVRVLPLPDLGPKGDVINWLEAGGTREKLLELVEGTTNWRPPSQGSIKLDGLLSSAADLQNETFDPLRMIVPKYVPEGLTLLAGKPKVGKSFWALDVGIAVAVGGECMGERCEQGDVLALMLDDKSRRRLQRRLTKMLGAQRQEWPRALQYATAWPRLNEGGLDLLREWIGRAKRPRLIIIDILEQVRQRVPINQRASQYSTDYDALIELQKIANEYQLAILVVHHQRKQGADDLIDTVSGTLGLGGAVDTVLILGKDDTGKFLYGRGRDLDEFNVAVKQNEHSRWQVLGLKQEEQASPERNRVIAALTRAGRPMNVVGITAAIGGKQANVKKLLATMHAEGIIERIATGLYRLPKVQADMPF
jgi:AAA domain